MNTIPFQSGHFFIGCNYWASHAGTRMWSDWNEEVVMDDLRRLAEANVTTLRVFPLWSDFQPLRLHLGCAGAPKEVRLGEEPLPATESGRAGLHEVMLSRFARFCDLAHAQGIRLIVGLLTGWMSGRIFAPEMLQGRNLLTDPMALQWEIRFVRQMVRLFRQHPALLAWDLGNECNCMGRVQNAEEAYLWAAAIATTIRAEDAAHPVISGMHGLTTDGPWRVQDQGELMDILCTHPYPLFTPHCDTDPVNRMKSALHAAAESCLYADLGGKPCFAEETGILGPTVASEEYAADYLRAALFTLFAHDCRGMLWWCAHDQTDLAHTPYDWGAVERELGLLRTDRTKKPVLEEMTRFSRLIERLPFDRLPPALTDAVCILPQVPDVWAVAYGAFILGKQAGLTLRFAWCQDPLPDAPVYLLPSAEGFDSLTRRAQLALMDKVRSGATLLLTMDAAILSPFAELTGVRVLTRAHQPCTLPVTLDRIQFRLDVQHRLQLESVGAEILLRTDEGEILFARNALGQGQVYTLFAPIEKLMATRPGAVDGPDALPCHLFYRALPLRSAAHAATIDLPHAGLTEHIIDEHARCLVIVNYEPSPQSVHLTLADGWRISACLSENDNIQPDGSSLPLPANDGAVILLTHD